MPSLRRGSRAMVLPILFIKTYIYFPVGLTGKVGPPFDCIPFFLLTLSLLRSSQKPGPIPAPKILGSSPPVYFPVGRPLTNFCAQLLIAAHALVLLTDLGSHPLLSRLFIIPFPPLWTSTQPTQFNSNNANDDFMALLLVAPEPLPNYIGPFVYLMGTFGFLSLSC